MSISVASSQHHLSLFVLHWFCFVYLRLAQEKHYFLTREITSIVSLPAFDQEFVIHLSAVQSLKT